MVPAPSTPKKTVYYSPYSAANDSPQSLPEDQLDAYQSMDYEQDGSDGSTANFLADYDLDGETYSRNQNSNPSQMTVVQPLQHQVIDSHQKYFKSPR